jgi:glycosyltransferase involved in cell wall biosynthesis
MAEEQQEQQSGQQPRRDNPFRRRNFKKPFPRPQQQQPESEFPSLEKAEELPVSIFPEAAEAKKPQEKQQHQRHQPQQQHGGKPYISVVIPLLNEEESLRELHEQLKSALSRIGGNYELIFVDDGSTDNSFRVLKELRQRNNRVKAIRFRRNFGKSAALAVGFQKAQGEFVVTMDADLQDDPSEIQNLIRELKGGFDVVSGWKKKRRDPFTKTLPSKFFNFVTAKVTGIKIHDFNCGLKGYRRDVVKSVNVYGELHRYIPALAHWQGFKVGETVVNHRPRRFGKTKFGMARFTRGFLDLLTVIFTTRYVTRPLHLFGGWGIVSAFIGTAIALWLTYEKYFNDQPLSNRPLFIVALIMVIVGVQFVSMGLLGELITRNQHMEREYSVREELN